MTPARKPKSRASAILGTGAALLVASYVLAETIPTEDPVVVVGRRPDGFVLTCTTAFCFDAVQEEAARALLEWQRMYAELPPDDLPLDGERFCQLLAADKPPGCNLGNPPPSPGVTVPGQAPWQPNGCGTGGIGGWFQDAVLEVIASQSYSGDIHAPYPGVSFRAACNEHDRCWAVGGYAPCLRCGFQAKHGKCMRCGCGSVRIQHLHGLCRAVSRRRLHNRSFSCCLRQLRRQPSMCPLGARHAGERL